MTAALRKPIGDHWSADHVGLPARDPLSPCHVDLVRRVYRQELGISLPRHSAGDGWEKVDPSEAEDFDLVVFGHGGVIGHVGLIAGGPWSMLHLPEVNDNEELALSRVELFDNGSFLPRLHGVYRRCEPAQHEEASFPEPLAGCVSVIGVSFVNPSAASSLFTFSAGHSLAELVAKLYPLTSEEQRARMRVTVGRAGVPRENWTEYRRASWSTIRPLTGLTVAVYPLPGAIPWGKVVGLLAITAALAAGQYYLAPYLAGTFFASALGSAAIGTGLAAASLLLAGLQPGPEKDSGRQNFAATGWENQARLFQPVPDPLGKTRDAPAYGAPPYISLGLGTPEESVTWPYVFDSATGNVDPGAAKVRFSATVAGVPQTLTIRLDNLDSNGVDHSAKFDQWLADGTDLTIRVSKVSNAGIYVAGTIGAIGSESGYRNFTVTTTAFANPGGVFIADTDPVKVNIATSAVNSDVLFLHGLFVEAVGEGVITSRRFGDTPIENFDQGEGNPIEIEEAVVEPGSEWPITVYDHQVVPTDPSTMGASFEGKFEDTDYVERVAARDSTGIEVFIRFSAGLYNTNGDSGHVESARVNFVWEYAPLGTEDWTVLDWTEQKEESRIPIFFSRKWDVPRGDYKVRTKKTGRDDAWDVDSSQATYEWIALQAHRPEAPIACRAPLTVTAFRVRSTDQLQGTIKAYNRIFSRKAFYWNGSSWVFGETADPAAGFRYRLQSDALAVPYDNSTIDLVGLAAWAGYCDDNGLKFHSLGAGDKSLLDSLSEAAGAGRARSRRYNAKWGVVVDKPQAIISGHITPRNGWQISVTTERTPEANGFRVTFLDETSDYSTKTRIVPFPGFEEDEVTKPLEISLPYTNPETIYREATRLYYIMFELRLQKYAATAAWDHMTFAAGDRVVIDDGLLRTRISAVVMLASGNVITLDEKVTMEDGKTYQARIRHLPPAEDEDGTSPPAQSIVYDVVTVPGETNTIVLQAGTGTLPDDTSTDALPTKKDLAIFAETDAVGIDAVVEQITAGDDLTGQLLLSPYTPGLDALIDALDVPAWDGRVGTITGSGDAAPTGVAASVLFRIGTAVAAGFDIVASDFQPFARVTWNAAATTKYEVRWRVIGSVLPPSLVEVTTAAGATTGAASTSSFDEDEDYEVSVRKRGGTWSSWVSVPGVIMLLADPDTLLAKSSTVLMRAA